MNSKMTLLPGTLNNKEENLFQILVNSLPLQATLESMISRVPFQVFETEEKGIHLIQERTGLKRFLKRENIEKFYQLICREKTISPREVYCVPGGDFILTLLIQTKLIIQIREV